MSETKEPRAEIAEHTWFDNRSWQPKEPEASPEELPSPTVVEEPHPGSIAYLNQRLDEFDELYCDLGG